MAHTIPYDSFEDSKLLQEAGYTKIQIEIEIQRTKKRNEEISKVIDDSLATKQDVELIRRDIWWIKTVGAATGTIIISLLIYVIQHLK